MESDQDDVTRGWKFEGEPARPLRHHGKIRYLGWDIADKWALDADGQFWAQSGAHGGPLRSVGADQLAAMAIEDAQARREIASALGCLTLDPLERLETLYGTEILDLPVVDALLDDLDRKQVENDMLHERVLAKNRLIFQLGDQLYRCEQRLAMLRRAYRTLHNDRKAFLSELEEIDAS